MSEGKILPVKESMTAPSRPKNTEQLEDDDERKERKGRYKLQEGTISRLLNSVLGILEKMVPDLQGKMVLSPLECELVDEMATAPIEKYLRKAGIEGNTIEILAVLVIILSPRVFSIISVVQKKQKTTKEAKGVKTEPRKEDLKESPSKGV